jgi:hypothetical protein
VKHWIVFSRYMRNGRAEVLIFRDDKERELMHLHPGVNAVDAERWAELAKTDKAIALLESKQIEDRGEAPPEPEQAEETTAPETPQALAAAKAPEPTPASEK